MNDDTVKVLIVEGESQGCRLVEEMLRSSADAEFSIAKARSSARAVELLRGHQFDIMILSLNLIDTQGEETVNKFLPWLHKLPILLCNGDERCAAIRLRTIGVQHLLRIDDGPGPLIEAVVGTVNMHRESEELGSVVEGIQAAAVAFELEGTRTGKFEAAILALEPEEEV
jgi:CheY-like chemotaxis protein